VRIGRPLLKLPIRFCGDTLARELSALPDTAWIEHPQKFDGNIAIPLISPGGAITHQAFGPMGPTQWLGRCNYVMQAMQALQTTWGRSRFMGLEAGKVVPEHVDVHYYWRTHLRVHIPVITNPDVAFTCAGETIHMEPGECWLLDSFYKHEVWNRGEALRTHLVMDTVGSAHMWDLVHAALAGDASETFVTPGEGGGTPIEFEQINAPLIMSPWEMQAHIAYMSEWTDEQPGKAEIMAILDRFAMAWAGAWARYGISQEGLPVYVDCLNEMRAAVANYRGPDVIMRNDLPLGDTINRFILANAIAHPGLFERLQNRPGPPASLRQTA
jgi:aspartyl/asparaginyl beta-hydroxylase